MANYKGQAWNEEQDKNITTESLFKIIDADTGESVDVREILGITAEEFEANPELYSVMLNMNKE